MHILPSVLRKFSKMLSRASLAGDFFHYSHDHDVGFRGDMVRRNKMLVTLSGQRVKRGVGGGGIGR